MPDLVATVKRELVERLRAIDRQLEGVEELIEERTRIEHALAQPPLADQPIRGGRRRQSSRGARAPRGANREVTLAAIRERPGITASGLHDVTGIAKPALSRLTRSLVARGDLLSEDLPGGQRGFRLRSSLQETRAPRVRSAVSSAEGD